MLFVAVPCDLGLAPCRDGTRAQGLHFFPSLFNRLLGMVLPRGLPLWEPITLRKGPLMCTVGVFSGAFDKCLMVSFFVSTLTAVIQFKLTCLQCCLASCLWKCGCANPEKQKDSLCMPLPCFST